MARFQQSNNGSVAWRGATPARDWRGGYAGLPIPGFGQQMYFTGRPIPGVYESAAGYGYGQESATANGGIMAWWDSQETGTKIAIGIGAAAVAGILLYAIFGKKKATPNRRRRYKANRRRGRRRVTRAQARALGRIRGKRGRVKTGKIMTLRGGKRYGHLKPPKRYWKMGARRASDYADPEHYKYPLVFRDARGRVNQKKTAVHIRAAQAYFARNKKKYPITIRRRIARNINRAKRRYGVGGKVVKA